MTYYHSAADHLHAHGLMAMLTVSKIFLLQLLLILVLVVTGIALIFTKDTHHNLTNEYQRLLATENRLQVMQDQLLLEEGTFAKQSRVQALATQALAMRLPTHANTKRVYIPK